MQTPDNISDLRDILDAVYVQKDDCKDKTKEVENRIKANEDETSKLGKEFALTKQDVTYIKGIMKIIAASGIGTLLVSLLNLILK